MEGLRCGPLFRAYSSLIIFLQMVLSSAQQESTEPPPQQSILELEVLGFRVWMIIVFVGFGFTIIIVALCCIFDCRIPRTKQQIEQDHERRELILHYKNKIKAMQAKKSRFAQARQRTAMLMSDWAMEEGKQSTKKSSSNSNSTKVKDAAAAEPPVAESDDPAPLAQHPSAMLMGNQDSRNNVSNKPLGTMQLPMGNRATAKTLASLEVQDQQANTGL